MRTEYDLEMMREVGLLQRHRELLPAPVRAASRASGRTPCSTSSRDFLTIIDESHVTIPQLRGHVQRRLAAQAGAGGARIPAALGPGQPAA